MAVVRTCEINEMSNDAHVALSFALSYLIEFFYMPLK